MKQKRIDWTLGLKFCVNFDLDLQFSRSDLGFAATFWSQENMVQLPWNKITYRLNARPQMWGSILTLTMNFQGQTFDLLYRRKIWSDASKQEMYESTEYWAQNVAISFGLGLYLNLFSHVCELDINNSYWGDLRCWHAIMFMITRA